ncbi:MAG TPA: hypothetical protein VD906_05705 [Caulobacteraceae bacterium]|nr:hypothetical protein [Caulobacteraceae bacterium]
MRSIRLGLAAVLALFALAPATAMAAPKKDPAEALLAAKNRERGLAEAPAVVAATGVKCTIDDARLIGEDKKTKQAYYEVACKEGLGYILANAVNGGQPLAYTCLAAAAAPAEQAGVQCTFPRNTDHAAALSPFVQKAGRTCDVDRARYIGQGQKNTYFEVACKGGAGYVVVTTWPPDATAEVQMNTCLVYEQGNTLFCELTDRAAQLAPVNALVANSGKSCNIKDRRYILTSSKDASNYYEVACDNGHGYVVQEAANGSLTRILDCVSADFIGGGCTMTDSRAALTEQSALYTRLAGQAGFKCDVEKYATLPTTGPGEVIELACKNRPDGAIAIFSAGGAGQIYDCVRSELEGYRCSFTKQNLVYPKMSADLDRLGKGSCEVSDARAMGKTTDQGFIEVACADGDPGWVIGYPNNSSSAKEVLSCLQAQSFTSGCKLPTNKRR